MCIPLKNLGCGYYKLPYEGKREKCDTEYPAEAVVVSLPLMMVHFTAGSMLES